MIYRCHSIPFLQIPFTGSCPEFGSSGSGVVRQWAKRYDKKRFSIDDNSYSGRWYDTYQYSFVGPLSMQKGCDKAFHMYTKSIDSVKKSENPNAGIGFETNKLSYRGMDFCCHG